MSFVHSESVRRERAASGESLLGQEGRIVYRNGTNLWVLADGAAEDRGALGSNSGSLDRGGILIDGGTASGSLCSVCVGPVWALSGAAIAEGQRITGGTTDARVVPATVSGDIPLGFALTAATAAGQPVLVDYVGPADEAIA